MRWRIALLLLFVAAGAVLLEVVARHLCATDEQRRERLLTGDDYWIDRWLAGEDAKRSGSGEKGREPDPGPLAAGDVLHRHDPQLGWVPNENVRPSEKLEGVSTNSLGMRGARDFAPEKAPGERRIVVVGDSFTFGDGVKDEEVWTERLATKLGKSVGGVALLNLGVMGYGLDQQCLRLEQLGMSLHPDVVLVGLFADDLDRDELSVRDAPKPRFLLDGDGLKLDNVPVPTLEELRARVSRKQFGSYAWAMLRKMAAARTAEASDATKWELGRRILDRMHVAAGKGGAKLVVAFFPKKAVSFSADPDAYERMVLDWAGARNVPCIDVRPVFAKLGSNRFKDVWHNHWTPFGNQVVADAIHDGIREFNVLAAH